MQRSVHQGMSAQYRALKLAPPHGPQVRDAVSTSIDSAGFHLTRVCIVSSEALCDEEIQLPLPSMW